MIRKWLPLLVGLVTLLGCENDDDQRSNKFLRFSVQDEFIDQTDDYWILISDAEGNVLDIGRLQNAGTYSFAFPARLAEASLTMTLIHNRDLGKDWMSNTDITSYTNVPPGEYHFPEYREDGKRYNHAYMTAPVFGADDQLNWFFQGNLTRVDSTVSPDGVEIKASYWGDKAGLLVVTKAAPFQYQYFLLEPGEHEILMLEDLKASTPRTISLPGGNLSQLNVIGVNANGNFGYYSIVNNADYAETTWEIPTMPEIFDSYRVRLVKSNEEGHHETDVTYTVLPSELQILEGSIDVTVEGNVIDWTTTSTHSLDDVEIWAQASIGDDKFARWTIKGASGEQHVVLPAIPNAVLSPGMDEGTKLITFERVSHEYGVTAKIRDLPHYNGYRESVIGLDLQATKGIVPESLSKMQLLQP